MYFKLFTSTTCFTEEHVSEPLIGLQAIKSMRTWVYPITESHRGRKYFAKTAT